MPFPLDWVRAQFPALDQGTVFLDNAAGTQVPQVVVDAVTHTLVRANANRGGAHRPSREITERRERIRSLTAQFVGAASASNVAFGANATTLITLLALHVAKTLDPGDEIVVTELDHHANIDPWVASGAVIKRWPIRLPSGTLHVEDLPVTAKTRLVCITGASNILGTIPDVRAAADIAHAAGALVMVDAVHATPHLLPDVDALGADILVFSPYKVFGPHLGAMYLRDIDALPTPALEFLPAGDPIRWEPGTQNHEAIAGWGGVFDYLDELAVKTSHFGGGRYGWRGVYGDVARHEHTLASHLLDGLTQLGAEIYGLPETAGRTSTVAFNLPGKTAPEVAARLAERDVAVAAGHSYAYRLVMDTLGLADRGGVVRASAVHYNSIEDIDRLLEGLA